MSALMKRLAVLRDGATRDPAMLRPYQTEELLPFLRTHPFSGAFVAMGLGKTVTILTLIDQLWTEGRIERVLVIAPLRVAVQTWPTELAEWRHTWWMTHVLIRADEHHPDVRRVMASAREREGRKSLPGENAEDRGKRLRSAAGFSRTLHLDRQKRKLTNTPALVHIINREAVPWLVRHFGRKWPYDCVIVDESRSFSDYKALRWRALNSVRPFIKRMHLLSGVPAPEGIQDYFAQIYLLDRGARFGRGITAFREKYLMKDEYTFKWKPQTGAEEKVAAKIADICMVMREEDYLKLDKPLVIERPVLLDRYEMSRYRKFVNDMILDLPDGETIEAESGASLSGKLMQYASGAVYDGGGSWHEVHRHKLEELAEIVAEGDGSPLLVAYWHKSSLERLRKSFPKAKVMDRRGECVTDWNKGRIDMLFIHPRSAGHGLNMQLGPGHTLVWFDNPLPLEDYLQTCARLARSGQRHPVKIIHLVARGTLDATVVPLLRGKNDAQDAVRRYIRDWRKGRDNGGNGL